MTKHNNPEDHRLSDAGEEDAEGHRAGMVGDAGEEDDVEGHANRDLGDSAGAD